MILPPKTFSSYFVAELFTRGSTLVQDMCMILHQRLFLLGHLEFGELFTRGSTLFHTFSCFSFSKRHVHESSSNDFSFNEIFNFVAILLNLRFLQEVEFVIFTRSWIWDFYERLNLRFLQEVANMFLLVLLFLLNKSLGFTWSFLQNSVYNILNLVKFHNLFQHFFLLYF